MSAIVTGYQSAAVRLRETYRVQLTAAEVDELDQLAARFNERDALPIGYLDFIAAAAADLRQVAAFLEHEADQMDGHRAEIPVAAAVLAAFPAIDQLGKRLENAVERARQAAPEAES